MNIKRTHALSLMALSVILLSACGWFRGNNITNDSDQNSGPAYFLPSYDNNANEERNNNSSYDYANDTDDAPRIDAGGGAAVENLSPTASSGAESEASGAPAPDESISEKHDPDDPPYDDTFFQDYGVSPFVNTANDHLSTFAMDVDTGSFTIARSYLTDGYMPPTGAVRTEEFINYFPQGYPIPSFEETFGIYIDGAPTPFTETEGYQMIRIGIQGYQVPLSQRKPVSLTFVIDVSGSMGNGYRLDLVKDSFYMLVDQLRASDQVNIIAYTDTAWVVLKPTSGAEKRTIKNAIRALYPMNSTNAEAGLILGYEQASRAYMPGGVNRVILASDGVANVGNTGPGSIWESIKYYASEGITLTTIGVGMGNYNDVLLEQLADNGDGFYAYIDTLEEAERLFVKDLVGTLQIIAYDAKIQVDFNPEVVASYRLVGFENRGIADEDFTNDQVDAAEIGSGHSVTALYEIELHRGARGQIATVYIRWQDPDTMKIRETAQQFFTDELAGSFRTSSPYFQMAVLIAEFAEILRDSYWVEYRSFDDIAEYAQSITRFFDNDEFKGLIDMVEQAAWLAGY